MDSSIFPLERQLFRRILLLTTCVVYLSCLRQNIVQCAPSDDVNSDKSSRTTISVAVLNSTSVTVRWSQPPRNCPTQRYMIRLKQAGVRQSKAWRLEGERQWVSLHDLQPATEYQLRLTTINCDGLRKHSRWVKVVTTVEPPTAAPSNLRQDETQVPGQPISVSTRTSSDSAIVSWLPPDDNTLVRSYMIGYGEGVPDVKWIYVNGTERSVAILNLKPATQYVVSVRAINKLGKGLVVYDLVFTREAPSRDDLPAPTQLRTKVLTSHSVRLQWVDPSLDSTQHITDERYYNVYYHAVQTGKNLSVIVRALHVTLHDLLPDKLYRFKVRTVKGDQTSPFSDTVANKTLPVDSVSADDDVISLLNRTGSVSSRHDDYDYDPRDEMDDSGHIDVLQGKTKRAHGSRTRPPHPPSLARTVDDQPANRNGSTSSVAAAQTASLVHIPFRSLVQYRVSAYVTWPDRLPGSSCNVADGAAGHLPSAAVAGYIFRYKVLDGSANAVGQDANTGSSTLPAEYVVRNLATNFVLLDNLLPGVRYRYQVRYVPEKGEASAWSQEAEIDTTHTAQPQQQQRGRG